MDRRSLDLVRRALDHYLAKGTDQAPSTMEQTLDAYLNVDRYHHEDGNTQVKVVSNLSEVLELLAARRRHQGPEQGQLALVG